MTSRQQHDIPGFKPIMSAEGLLVRVLDRKEGFHTKGDWPLICSTPRSGAQACRQKRKDAYRSVRHVEGISTDDPEPPDLSLDKLPASKYTESSDIDL